MRCAWASSPGTSSSRARAGSISICSTAPLPGSADTASVTILCTPTATPPRWLTAYYPEVLRVDGNGRTMAHGSRQHADTASPVFRAHSQRITRAMAEHYRDNPHVIGWQTDNELNTSMSRSYSAATRREFQNYLETRYPDIGALNQAWGGDFWATAYDNFDQIVLPFEFAPVFPSPGHLQDYHRFLAFAVARFQHDQVTILRAANPAWFIFHNLGALEDIDFRGQFSADLDFLGFDLYPMLYDEIQRIGGHGEAQALHLDICRGFTGNFIVPEQQSGFGRPAGVLDADARTRRDAADGLQLDLARRRWSDVLPLAASAFRPGNPLMGIIGP